MAEKFIKIHTDVYITQYGYYKTLLSQCSGKNFVKATKELISRNFSGESEFSFSTLFTFHPFVFCFRWRFNSTTHFATLPPEKFYTDGSMSYASYTPKSEIDYGTLSCWATNEVGLQKSPCVFHVIPAGE